MATADDDMETEHDEEEEEEDGEEDEAADGAGEAGEDETEEEEDEDEDDEFDFEALAKQAVKVAESSKGRRHEERELSLDIGLSEEHLYMTSSNKSAAFDTAAPPGVSRLDHADFARGAGPSAPSSSSSSGAREVRGAPVRPVNDGKLRRKEAKEERESKLEKWFGLKRRKLTPELEKELLAIKLRGNYDPKRFYKGQDSKELPKYFAIATEVGGGMKAAGVQANQGDVRAHSGRSLLDEILRDNKAQDWTRKRHREVRMRGEDSLRSGHGTTKGRKKPKATHRGVNWRQKKKH